jgi:hypothetical protein
LVPYIPLWSSFFPGCWVDTSVWWYPIFCCHERSSHEAPFARPERPIVLFKAFLQKNHYQQHKAINLIFTIEFIRFYGLHHWLGKDCFQLQLTLQMILITRRKKKELLTLKSKFNVSVVDKDDCLSPIVSWNFNNFD